MQLSRHAIPQPWSLYANDALQLLSTQPVRRTPETKCGNKYFINIYTVVVCTNNNLVYRDSSRQRKQ